MGSTHQPTNPAATMRTLVLLSLAVSMTAAQFTFFGGQRNFGSFRQPPFRSSFQPFRRPAPQQPVRDGRFVSSFSSRPEAPSAAATASSASKGNYEWEGKNYLLTWRTGRNNFAWRDGVSYCRSQGMKLISLDSRKKADHFLALVGSDRAPYFWAGGELNADSTSLTWQNGKSEPVQRGQHPWSFTGRTGPQPDGGEKCLAILNDVYRDGVKFHDVACHHRKPVVCEE